MRCALPIVGVCALAVLGPFPVLSRPASADEWPRGAVGRLGTPKDGHPAGSRAVAFSPDGRILATGGKADVRNDRTVHIREAGTGRLLRALESNGREVRCLAFSPDGTALAAGGTDDQIFSPNGKWLVAGGRDGKVRLWNTASGVVVRVFSHRAAVTSVAFARDCSLLASGSEDGLTMLWSCP